MLNKIHKKSGLVRIFSAFRFSIDGLQAAFNHEEAFRQEVILFIVFLPLIYYLPVSPAFKALLFLANTLVLIVELLNSAIEAIVDLASPDYHDLAKQAKDMGSAAVMTSVFLALFLWGYAILDVI
jgi:diacylglycerol kinase (ATP)